MAIAFGLPAVRANVCRPRQVLPPRGRNPRPNLLHFCFDVLFVINSCLALRLWRKLG
jgi:hypothetical protein